MRIEASAAFTLGDLAIFDEAHLRLIISDASGAASPALVGRAFAGAPLEAPLQLCPCARRGGDR